MKKPANWDSLSMSARAKWFSTGRVSAVPGTARIADILIDGWRPKVKGNFVKPSRCPMGGIYPSKEAALEGARGFRDHCRNFKERITIDYGGKPLTEENRPGKT